MTIAAAVKRFLDGHSIVYHVASHARTVTLEQAAAELGIQQQQIARSVLLRDDFGFVMAVLPVTHRLDFHKLQLLLQRQLVVVSGKEADKLFVDCEPGSRPPLAEAYGIACVVDDSLTQSEDIYFEPGTHNALVHVTSQDFQDLLAKALRGSFSYLLANSRVVLQKHSETHSSCPQAKAQLSLERLQCFMNDRQRLPHLRLMKRLMGLYKGNQPEAEYQRVFAQLKTMGLLARVVEIYSKEVLKLPFSCLQGVSTLERRRSIIALVIGFLTAEALQVNTDGPYSNRKIWHHALYAAVLVEELAKKVSFQQTLDSNQAFFAALMQNVGVLLLGYLFPPEYKMLNRMGAACPEASLSMVQCKMIGMGQAHEIIALGYECLGAWLLRNWGFPAEVVQVAAQQSNPLLAESSSPYLHVVRLVNLLLAEHDLGRQGSTEHRDLYVAYLGISLSYLSDLHNKFLEVQIPIEKILAAV